MSEAEKFSEEDKKKREDVDVRNNADSMAYQTEKQLTELGDKVPEDVKEKVNQKLTELKSAVEGGDIAQMKEAQSPSKRSHGDGASNVSGITTTLCRIRRKHQFGF